jgi:phosphoserine phosphatase RsbU/P
MVGDVAGKGVPAALLMARLSADAQSSVLMEPDPARAITRLNGLLMQAGKADRFVTFAMAVLDTTQHRLHVVNAGHVPPLLRRAQTGKVEEVACGDAAGMPLGVLDSYLYSACSVDLQPGDCFVLCTDGVT